MIPKRYEVLKKLLIDAAGLKTDCLDCFGYQLSYYASSFHAKPFLACQKCTCVLYARTWAFEKVDRSTELTS